MPATNSVKQYLSNSYYHLYNRGVEKRKIFLDRQDFAVYLSYLKDYLSPKDKTKLNNLAFSTDATYGQRQKAIKDLKRNNFFGEIELACYALIPNHFHLLVKQNGADSIDRFLNSLGTRYTLYFNRRYNRVGKLYQGVYKAVLVDSDEQLLHLSRYIHLNPLQKPNLVENYTSLPEFLGQRQTPWIKPSHILDYFGKTNPKNKYVDFLNEKINADFISPITIDFEAESE